MENRITVIEFRTVANGDGKPLRAFVDIEINGWIVREFRVIKQEGKRPWVASPQISWKAPDGRIQYKTILTLPDEIKGEVDLLILKKFNEEMEQVRHEAT